RVPCREVAGSTLSGTRQGPVGSSIREGFGGNTHGPDVNLAARSAAGVVAQRIFIEDVYPSVDAGRFAVKRIAGEPIEVWADIFQEGHGLVAAELIWRPKGAGRWQRAAMRLDSNDRWTAAFVPPCPGHYQYAIEAWRDVFG